MENQLPPNIILSNVNVFEGDILICDSYVPEIAPQFLVELSVGRKVYHFAPEFTHSDILGFKLCTILRIGKVTSVTVFTKDGSPHGLQIPLMVQEAVENTQFDKTNVRYYVWEKTQLYEVNDQSVRRARHLNEVQGQSLSKVKNKIAIILGGKDDENTVAESGMMTILERLGIAYEYSIISSDQNPDALREYCLHAWEEGVRIFIGIAGLVPALPGAIKALLPLATVICVPLTSEDYDAKEIILASLSVPSKRPVIILGVNRAGLKKASYCAAELLSISNPLLLEKIIHYLDEETAVASPRLKEFLVD